MPDMGFAVAILVCLATTCLMGEAPAYSCSTKSDCAYQGCGDVPCTDSPTCKAPRGAAAGTIMRPDDRNVSETLARIVEEQVVAATWRLELRVYLFLAAALMASLAAPLFVLYKMQNKLDRAQRELQSAGAEVSDGSSSLPEHEPSAPAPSRARRRPLPTSSVSETDLDARPGTRLLQRPNQASATSAPLHKQVCTLASSVSSKSHSPSSRGPSLRSHSRPSHYRGAAGAVKRGLKHHASRHGSPDRGLPQSPPQVAGVVQPLRDSFKRRVTSGSERQAENQRGLSLEDPLPPFKECVKRFLNTQSQPALSSQASEPAAMRTRPLRAFSRSDPALWTVWEGCRETLRAPLDPRQSLEESQTAIYRCMSALFVTTIAFFPFRQSTWFARRAQSCRVA